MNIFARTILGWLCVQMAVGTGSPATGGQRESTLWCGQPAEKWVEALPLGNGRLGAMVFGGPDKERLPLNEESL